VTRECHAGICGSPGVRFPRATRPLKINIWKLTPLYLGEIISVWAFGVSWLTKGKDLRSIFDRTSRSGKSEVDSPDDVPADASR